MAHAGTTSIQLALHFSEWIHRRRFVVQFVNDKTIRIRMTVDFTLPPPDRLLVAPARGEQIAVPLHILADVPLTGVDLVSEDGCPLPLLTTAEAADLSISGISSILAVLAVRARVDHLLDGEAIAREVGAIVGRDKTRRGEALGAADDPSTAFGAALASSTPLRALLRDLSHSTLTLVPLAYEPDRRRVVKIAWDWPFYWRRHADTRPTPYPLTPESERARRTGAVLAFLGWSDTPLAIGDLPFGWARSTHVELVAPADVELHSASLTLSQRDPATGRWTRTELITDERCQLRQNLGAEPLAKGDPTSDEIAYRAFLQARGDVGTVRADFRIPFSSALPAALVVSVITSVLLWLLPGQLAKLDGQTSAAVLLILPALIGAYLLRPGEQPLATRLLAGVRACALVVGLCSIAAAAIIGLATLTVGTGAERRPHEGTQGWLELIAAVSALATSVIALVLILRVYRRVKRWLDDGTRYAVPVATTAEGATLSA